MPVDYNTWSQWWEQLFSSVHGGRAFYRGSYRSGTFIELWVEPTPRRMTVTYNMGPSFAGSVQLQAWAKANGCPWNYMILRRRCRGFCGGYCREDCGRY